MTIQPHSHRARSLAIPQSLLRLSAWQRLGGAAALTAILWLAVLWAMS